MSAPPGFGAPPGFPPQGSQPNGESRMDGDFFGQLSPEEIEKKARKWRTSQKKRFNEKRRTGGGAGVDFGKAVSAHEANVADGEMFKGKSSKNQRQRDEEDGGGVRSMVQIMTGLIRCCRNCRQSISEKSSRIMVTCQTESSATTSVSTWAR